MSLVVFGVPSSAGAHGVGQEKAPAALRVAGLVDALRAAGLDVDDAGDLEEVRFRPDPARPKQQNLDRVVELASPVATRVTSLIRQGHLPIVLGGDAPSRWVSLQAWLRLIPRFRWCTSMARPI